MRVKMDFSTFASVVANLAQTFLVIWILVFGSKTIKEIIDIIQAKSQQRSPRVGRFLMSFTILVTIVVLLFFMPLPIKFIGFIIITLIAPFFIPSAIKIWIHNKLLQNPRRSIPIMLSFSTFLLAYSLVATLFLGQVFIPTLFASSFPITLKCSTCQSNDFNVVIRLFTIDKTMKTITLDTTITSNATQSLGFLSDSFLIDSNNNKILGEPDDCDIAECILSPNTSKDINQAAIADAH